MNSVRRTRGIRKFIRVTILRRPVQKHVAAGDIACGKLVREAQPAPSDKAIYDWARFDLIREIMGGFWDIQAA